MAIHPKKHDTFRRRHESLGHVRISLEELEDLVDGWSHWCDAITISLGDGLTADTISDLKYAKRSEIAHLAIHTEEPSATVLLHKHKAELSYSQNSPDLSAVNDIRLSLKPYRILTPFYRLRGFWWWLYLAAATSWIMYIRDSHSWALPFWPLYFPLSSVLILGVWNIYAINRLRHRSSTRIKRDSRWQRTVESIKSIPWWVGALIFIFVGVVLGKYFG